MKRRISVIIPTYNEKENITKLIYSINKNSGDLIQEIIIVDDNSPDGTWVIIKKLMVKTKKLKLIRRMKEKGLPSAISEGIKNAKSDYVLWMDSDLSHPSSLIRTMVKFIPKYDIISASRYVENGHDKRQFFRVVASSLLNIFGRLILNIKIKDLTSGFYLVRKTVFDKISLKSNGYAEYCIRFTYESIAKGFKWKEVPYTFTDREEGSSKSYLNIINFLKNGYLCLREILRLRFF